MSVYVRVYTRPEAWDRIAALLNEMRYASVNELEDALYDPVVRWDHRVEEIDSLLWLIDPTLTLEKD